jgi:endo-1,4-beta-xylanase
MGMQGHYDTKEGSPDMIHFEAAARAYAEVTGKVQMTEMDLKATDNYDGTENTMKEEYQREAGRYSEIFSSIRKLEKEGVNFEGITFWGVVDGHSWLQYFCNVGGGAGGKHKQVPLLFDDNDQPKPAFFSFILK